MRADRVVFIATLAILTFVYTSTARKECRDRHRSCRQIGKKKPLSRCYRKHTSHECCATCRRLKIDIPDCEYGDKQKWCSSIGRRYSIASCYESKDDCCQTCHNLDTGIPDCPYGDKVQWCLHIGTIYGTDTCLTGGNVTCCETCHKLNEPSSTTAAPTEPIVTNTSNLPPGVHGHVVSSESITRSQDDSLNTQPIPTSSASTKLSVTHSLPTSETNPHSKSSNTSHPETLQHNPQRPSNTSSSLNKGQLGPTKQSSTQTDDHVTQRVSHVNKMAEFYVSISPAPRTTPNIPNTEIKHIENTPSPTPSLDSSVDDKETHSMDMDEILLPIEDSEGVIDNAQPTDNIDQVQYPEQTDHDMSRSQNGGYSEMETDDEDLLAGMGSGHHSNTPKRQHDRFAFEHDMWGGENNIYDEAEKEYVYDEFPVHASSTLPQTSLMVASLSLFIALLSQL